MWLKLARLLPMKLRYWVVLEAYVEASHQNPTTNVNDLTFDQVSRAMNSYSSKGSQSLPKAAVET